MSAGRLAGILTIAARLSASVGRGLSDARRGKRRKRKQADFDREDAARVKRERKNAKRSEDWHRCWQGRGATWQGRYWPTEGADHGK